MKQPSRILIRATNWVGDTIMSMPAVEQIRGFFPSAHIAVLARPSVAGLYRQPLIDEVIAYTADPDWKDLRGRWHLAAALRARRFDAAILLQNAFDAAFIAWLAGIPVRIGYSLNRRGLLLTDPIDVPSPAAIPQHQSYYYLELLHRAGMLDALPEHPLIRLEGLSALRLAGQQRLSGRWIGVSPGSANGLAKRWLPDRFAASAAMAAAELDASVAVFGSADESDVCDRVAGLVRGQGIEATTFAGRTSISEFLELASACIAFITNDSGSMHVAGALGVPTVAVFGPTSPAATGPTDPLTTVIREPVDCSPCLLHTCPIDHRCMTAVHAMPVAAELVRLVRLGRMNDEQEPDHPAAT